MTQILLNGHSLTLDDVESVARHGTPASLSPAPDVRNRIAASRELVTTLLASGLPVYGVTTGVGESADRQVAADRAAAMQLNLVRKCGCGSGPTLPADQARAAVLIRANCFARGYSPAPRACDSRIGPAPPRKLLARSATRNGLLVPLIPEQGSVGASSDLVPGSYIAAALVGERGVLRCGERIPAARAWEEAGRTPLTPLEPKEGLLRIGERRITVTNAGLPRVDRLLPSFFLLRHQGVRYS